MAYKILYAVDKQLFDKMLNSRNFHQGFLGISDKLLLKTIFCVTLIGLPLRHNVKDGDFGVSGSLHYMF